MQVYRSLDHGKASRRCKSDKLSLFPADIQDFANAFVAMQIKRHDSDYNPQAKAFKSAVSADITVAKDVIAKFNAVPTKHRRAFAVWMLMEERKG